MRLQLSDERLALTHLVRYKALTLSQLGVLLERTDDEVYALVKDLKEEGWIVVRPKPNDRRERYIVLSHAGEEKVRLEGLYRSIKPVAYYRGDKVERRLATNEVLVQLLKHGVPLEAILAREEALKALNLRPEQAAISWMLDFGSRKYAIYMRFPNIKRRIEETVNALGPQKIDGHLIFYESGERLQKERTGYVRSNPPAKNYILVDMEQDLKELTDWLRAPHEWVQQTKKAMDLLSPGGRITQAPYLEKTAWVWEKRERVLLVNLLIKNVGIAALMQRSSPIEMRKEGWGSYVMFLVPSYRDAETWARLMGWREWHWFVVADGLRVYRVREEMLHPVPPKVAMATAPSAQLAEGVK